MNRVAGNSLIYQLTMHQMLPVDFGAYVDGIAKGVWCAPEPLGKPIGVWQSVVGELNRVFFLHLLNDKDVADRTHLADTTTQVPLPIARSVQMLRAVKPVVIPPESSKLIELRLYTLIPGNLDRYVALLLDALPSREKYSRNVGIWTPITGAVDTLVHMWAYEDANQRAALRPAINADPVWRDFVPAILPLIIGIQTYFLSSVPLPWPTHESALAV